MELAKRTLLVFLMAIVVSLGSFAITGCTDDTTQAQSSAASQADGEQDNCYGNDLPAKK